MSLLVRSAMIQARVTPWVKQRSRLVLQELGLTMSEAMELFLRKIIVEERIPFDIVALSEVHRLGDAVAVHTRSARRGSRKKNSKDFLT